MSAPFEHNMSVEDPCALAVKAALEAALKTARTAYDGRELDEAPVEGASIIERSVVSIVIQVAIRAALQMDLKPFNVHDGVAHAIAGHCAQLGPAKQQVFDFTLNQAAGYFARYGGDGR